MPNSDKAFPANGPVELEFAHGGTSNDIEDFVIRVGYDANGSATLEPSEQLKFVLKTGLQNRPPSTGEPSVRGTNTSAYNSAMSGLLGVNRIIDGTYSGATDLALPHVYRHRITFDINDSALP